MSQVKKIQCSSCGATSVFKLNDEVYKCNYCQTEFKVEDNTAKTKKELNSALHQLRKQTAENAMRNPAKAKKLGCAIALAVIIFTAGIVGFVFFTVKDKAMSGFHSIMTGWQAPSLNKYIAFTGSKGAVVWEILELSRTKLDSSKHVLRIINPKTNDILVEKQFGEATSWSDNFNWSKKLSHEFLLVNDTLYNGSEDGGLQAFNLYTGERILSNEDFEKRFPQLKEGIAKVESRLYNNGYVFYTNDGDEFYYYPSRRIFRNKKAADKAYKTDTVTQSNFYIGEGKKCGLYYATQKEKFNQNSEISERDVKNYNEGDHYARKQYKKLQRVGDQYYPYAQRLVSTKDFVVLAYLSDFSKKAKPIIEKIDANGKILWKNQDTAFIAFIENLSTDNLYFRYYHSAKEIVFYNSSSTKRSIGIDMNTGKTLFVHSQGYNFN